MIKGKIFTETVSRLTKAIETLSLTGTLAAFVRWTPGAGPGNPKKKETTTWDGLLLMADIR